MKYLLDTSVFLWGVAAEERLNAMAQEVLTAASSELYLSVAGAWEIAVRPRLAPASEGAFRIHSLRAAVVEHSNAQYHPRTRLACRRIACASPGSV